MKATPSSSRTYLQLGVDVEGLTIEAGDGVDSREDAGEDEASDLSEFQQNVVASRCMNVIGAHVYNIQCVFFQLICYYVSCRCDVIKSCIRQEETCPCLGAASAEIRQLTLYNTVT